MQVIRYNIFAVRKEDSIELGMSDGTLESSESSYRSGGAAQRCVSGDILIPSSCSHPQHWYPGAGRPGRAAGTDQAGGPLTAALPEAFSGVFWLSSVLSSCSARFCPVCERCRWWVGYACHTMTKLHSVCRYLYVH